MLSRWFYLVFLTGLSLAGCSAGPNAGSASVDALHCVPQQDPAGRTSPYDSVMISSGDLHAKICYGRPSSRGRTMIGGELVPYGRLWRTGANEPTIIHLGIAAKIAGLAVEPGSYSLYTVPGESEWEVIVNRSITQWGHESTYNEEVASQEVGRTTLPREVIQEPIETFTIRSEETGAGTAQLYLEWETTRIEIPIVAQAS